MENTCISVINGKILMKFCTWVAHDKPIAHANQNSEMSTYVINNDVIILKSEGFCRKALNFKRLYLSNMWIKHWKSYEKTYYENILVFKKPNYFENILCFFFL